MKVYFKLNNFEQHSFDEGGTAICLDFLSTWLEYKSRRQILSDKPLKDKFVYTNHILARIRWDDLKKSWFNTKHKQYVYSDEVFYGER